MILDAVTLVADAWILVTYAVLVRSGRTRPYHWANALGCIPLSAVEVVTGAWAVLPLTAAFGALGWYGLLRRPEVVAACACGETTMEGCADRPARHCGSYGRTRPFITIGRFGERTEYPPPGTCDRGMGGDGWYCSLDAGHGGPCPLWDRPERQL